MRLGLCALAVFVPLCPAAVQLRVAHAELAARHAANPFIYPDPTRAPHPAGPSQALDEGGAAAAAPAFCGMLII